MEENKHKIGVNKILKIETYDGNVIELIIRDKIKSIVVEEIPYKENGTSKEKYIKTKKSEISSKDLDSMFADDSFCK